MCRRTALGRNGSALRLRTAGFAAALLDGCSTAPRLPGNGGRAWLRKVRLTGGLEPAISVLSVCAASGTSGMGAGFLRAAKHFALADKCGLSQTHAALPWPSALHLRPGAVQWRTHVLVGFQMIRSPREVEARGPAVFKAILSYEPSLQPAWARGGPASKKVK